MEFLSTPNAERQYSSLIGEVKEFVKDRKKSGFLPWLLQRFEKKFYDSSVQFALPIFFVAEEDLDKTIPIYDWIGFRDSVLKFPDTVKVPSAGDFDYRHNLLENIERAFNPQNENQKQLLVEWKGSFDWLGLYYGFKSSFRCIFIRIEKIMKEVSLLSNPFGVTSVVLHEVAHALMDPGCFSDLKFTTPASKQVADVLDYCLEEALANLIAYRSIRSRKISRETVRSIAEFMKNQPMPYSLGIKMGLAERTKYSSLDFIIKSYVLKWYMAKSDKENLAIDDYKGWWGMVKKSGPFTDTELKEQYERLFS
ncbi:MAG: hypothetical protein J1E95_08960 [Muribaculaceae bacterium]|nr:hypothetical protein [Muribaculaceae bacterium]